MGHAALVLLEGVVPRLCIAAEVIRGEPGAVRRERPLSPEELLTLVEPVEGVLGAVIGGEVKLGEARRCLSMTAVSVRLGGMEQQRGWRWSGVHMWSVGKWWPVEASMETRGAGGPVVRQGGRRLVRGHGVDWRR